MDLDLLLILGLKVSSRMISLATDSLGSLRFSYRSMGRGRFSAISSDFLLSKGVNLGSSSELKLFLGRTLGVFAPRGLGLGDGLLRAQFSLFCCCREYFVMSGVLVDLSIWSNLSNVSLLVFGWVGFCL